MTVEEPDADATSIVPEVQIRLADFLKGDPPLPRAVLLVVSGEARGAVLPVERCPARVGRAEDADIVVDDASVSRHHAVILDDGGSLLVEDLGSSNGSTMNGNPITGPMHLADGDLVGLGSATVLVKLVA